MSINAEQTRQSIQDSIFRTGADVSRLDVYRAAEMYRRAGLSFIPISADQTKRPAFELLPLVWPEDKPPRRSWRTFKERQPTHEDVQAWFLDSYPLRQYGLAIVGGAVSGGLEIIDIDTADLAEPWAEVVEKRCPGLIRRLVRVRTPRPGLHAYFRSEAAGGNRKLARVVERRQDETRDRAKTVIELKGEGGYCLAPPSPPACHPTARCYTYLDGMDLTMVPTISLEERQILFDAASEFDTWREHLRKRHSHRRRRHLRQVGSTAERPGDDLNQRGDWAEILAPHGWQLEGDDGAQGEYWCRPGKSHGVSATVNHDGCNLLYVFSTAADPFDERTAYTKFHAYALLNHGGDFSAAAAALRAKGFGGSRSIRLRSRSVDPYDGVTLHCGNRSKQR